MPADAIPVHREDEPTVTITVFTLGHHAKCTGEVVFEATTQRRICLACGEVGAELEPEGLDFEITETP